MSLARYLANLLNSSGQVDLTTKVVNQLPNANIAAMAASKLTGQVPDANAPSGSVIQVVYNETADRTAWAGLTDWTDTGITATITPSSASNRILVMVDGKFGGSTSGINFTLRMLRNGSLIYAGTDTGNKQGFAHFEQGWDAFKYFIMPANATTVDSPASTSALTYKIQIRPNGTGSTIFMNRTENNTSAQGNTRSSITLVEIAA